MDCVPRTTDAGLGIKHRLFALSRALDDRAEELLRILQI